MTHPYLVNQAVIDVAQYTLEVFRVTQNVWAHLGMASSQTPNTKAVG